VLPQAGTSYFFFAYLIADGAKFFTTWLFRIATFYFSLASTVGPRLGKRGKKVQEEFGWEVGMGRSPGAGPPAHGFLEAGDKMLTSEDDRRFRRRLRLVIFSFFFGSRERAV